MSHSLPRRRHIPMGNTETYPTRVLGAYSSKAVGGGAFKGGRRRHLSKAVGKGGRWRHIPTGNVEAHSTRALGAYLSKAVAGGAFKGGRQRHIPTGNAEAHSTRALRAYSSKAVGGGGFKGGHKGSLKYKGRPGSIGGRSA
ncbi:hypothetical protein B0H17DRAFT_1147897 [Mycena rosella]|uniref:Uncharacterized protein n=1 Tax=Mycena rosella TaxID=1033263 RepID=A0AAD7G087_MYCRO|nr:hypothetical protein B0H17DRAFT_1147897 [Mycena rosella]